MTEAMITTPSESEGQRAAADRLETGLRDGAWRDNELWLGFTALPHAPADYQRLRQLWLDSPRACRNRSVPMAVVARAAMLEDEHVEARLLLRKAILSRSKYNRRLTVRLRLKGRRRVELPLPDAEHADGPTRETLAYLRLYNAITMRDRTDRDRHTADLAAKGEGEWLGRL